MSTAPWPLNLLRSTRAEPPGLAADDPARRALFGAALQQFDELLTAAEVTGYASRPLPLFYALSQAGRAFAAAFAESPKIGAHGLAEDRSSAEKSILCRRFRRRPFANDALSVVCTALELPDPFPEQGERTIALGAAWAAVPRLNMYVPDWQPSWAPVLSAYPSETAHDTSMTRDDAPWTSLFVDRAVPRENAELEHRRYPYLPSDFGWDSVIRRGPARTTDSALGTIAWGAPPASGLEVTHLDLQDSNERWLFPAAENGTAPFTPLTAWWVLLFGLSIVARYDPGPWSRALNLDDSLGYAVPLRLVLDEALSRLPWVVLAALLGKAKAGAT
jgi:hypothetical protein